MRAPAAAAAVAELRRTARWSVDPPDIRHARLSVRHRSVVPSAGPSSARPSSARPLTRSVSSVRPSVGPSVRQLRPVVRHSVSVGPSAAVSPVRRSVCRRPLVVCRRQLRPLVVCRRQLRLGGAVAPSAEAALQRRSPGTNERSVTDSAGQWGVSPPGKLVHQSTAGAADRPGSLYAGRFVPPLSGITIAGFITNFLTNTIRPV